jgi:hypothetical protein
VDQVILLNQTGRTSHEDICSSLDLFAREVMPEFRDRDAARERDKQAALAPHLEAALARKVWMRPLADAEIPEITAMGRPIHEAAAADGPPPSLVPLRDPVAGG